MKKKRICLVLAATMLLSTLFAGCGSKQDDAGRDADIRQDAERNNDAGEDTDEKIVITLGRHTTTNPKLPEGATYEDNAYIRMAEAELGIDIVDEFEGSNEDYDRQVSLAISAGSMPDVMKIHTQAELSELWENDMILDLTDVYEQYASEELKAKYASYPEGLGLDRARIDGHLVALPGAGGDVAPMICFVRQDWLDILGIKMDEDGDRVVSYLEILDVARKFMAGNPENVENPVGIAAIPDLVWYEGEGAWGLNFISNAMNAWPKTWYEENGKVVWGSTSEETREWLRFCNQLFEEGVLDPQIGTRQWDDVTALMTNGQFGFAFGAGHTPNWGLVNVYNLDEDCECNAFLISDENGVVRHKHSDSAQQGMIVVSKECKHPEKAIQIANLFNGMTGEEETALKEKYPEFGEYQDVLGVDHSCMPYNIDVGRYDSSLRASLLRDAYFAGEMTMDEVVAQDAGMLNNLTAIEKYMNGESKDPVDWAKYTGDWVGYSLNKTLDEYEKAEWLTPLFPSTTETMKTNWANLQALEAETFVKIVTGDVDVDEGFDSFVKQWKEQGGDKICQEIAKELGLK